MMDSQKRTKPAERSASAPKVLAVFRADCKASRGPGSTLAVVQGGSGKCRLYGRNSLANAYPEFADVCKTLTVAETMALQFGVKVVIGKVACEKFMADNKLSFAGSEKILADVGQGHKKRGGFKAINYATFIIGLFCLIGGCDWYRSVEGVGWQGTGSGYFQCYVEADCSGF